MIRQNLLEMKKFCFFLILISSVLLAGCNYKIRKSEYLNSQEFRNRVNKLCENEEVQILTIDSTRYFALHLQMTSDSVITFTEKLNYEKITIS
jgi:hypothetical protein